MDLTHFDKEATYIELSLFKSIFEIDAEDGIPKFTFVCTPMSLLKSVEYKKNVIRLMLELTKPPHDVKATFFIKIKNEVQES